MEKCRSLKTMRLTMGFLAISSQPIAPKMPRNARSAISRMKFEPNQSSSSAIHHDLQAAKANGDEGQADIVDAAAFLLLQPGRVLDQHRNQEYGDGSGRDVNEENPSPTPLVDDVA